MSDFPTASSTRTATDLAARAPEIPHDRFTAAVEHTGLAGDFAGAAMELAESFHIPIEKVLGRATPAVGAALSGIGFLLEASAGIADANMKGNAAYVRNSYLTAMASAVTELAQVHPSQLSLERFAPGHRVDLQKLAERPPSVQSAWFNEARQGVINTAREHAFNAVSKMSPAEYEQFVADHESIVRTLRAMPLKSR